MHAAIPSNPIPDVVLALMQAVSSFFRAVYTNYDIEFRRRERITNRLDAIYRIAAALFARIHVRMPRRLGAHRLGARPPSARPATPRPAPTRTAATPHDPAAPAAPRRKCLGSARTLAARLVRELDRVASEIQTPIPEQIRTLLDQVLEALDLTRETIRDRARALRTRMSRYAQAAPTPAPKPPAADHPPRPEPPSRPPPRPRTPYRWANIFER